jgi:serine protease Do
MAMRKLLAVFLAIVLCGCAAQTASPQGSVVPGTIGVAVQRAGEGMVVVTAVGKGSPAERAGLRVGDRVLRYNGEAVGEVRQFERLVLESVPGTLAHIEISRGGAARELDVPVEQVRTATRA